MKFAFAFLTLFATLSSARSQCVNGRCQVPASPTFVDATKWYQPVAPVASNERIVSVVTIYPDGTRVQTYPTTSSSSTLPPRVSPVIRQPAWYPSLIASPTCGSCPAGNCPTCPAACPNGRCPASK